MMKTPLFKSIFFVSSCVVSALTSLSSWALSISPIIPKIEYNTRSTQLVLKNDGETDQIFEIKVMKWIKQNEQGEDQLEPTNAVIPSLPVVMVKVKERYTVRLIAKERVSATQDTYRLVLRDITPDKFSGKDKNKTAQTGIKVGKFVLPLFVMNDDVSQGKLELKNGALTNIGGRTVLVKEWEDIKTGKLVKTARYLLPKQTLNLNVKQLETVKSIYVFD